MNKMKNILALAIIIASFVCIAATHPGHGLKIGDKASAFSLKNIDGEMLSLESIKDANGYVVVFTCNHCPYSVMYEDRLIELHNKFAPQGYPVVAINPNDPEVQPMDSYDEMIVRAKEKSFPFAYLFDDGQKVMEAFGAKKTPHVFLLDKEMVVQYIGAIDDSARDAEAVSEKYLENAIAALQAGKTPEPTVTKAIGCSVKSKGMKGGKKGPKGKRKDKKKMEH